MQKVGCEADVGVGGMGSGSGRGESGESLSYGTCKRNCYDKCLKFFGV